MNDFALRYAWFERDGLDSLKVKWRQHHHCELETVVL